jgi:transcriptional regulator GlxA family with amidase domain
MTISCQISFLGNGCPPPRKHRLVREHNGSTLDLPDGSNRWPLIAKRLRPRRPIANGAWTSAGMSASIDLMRALIEKGAGAEVSRAVAKKLVLHHRRAGGQSQFSALLQMESKSDRIQTALASPEGIYTSGWRSRISANAANLSARQFTRAFIAETGQSPAKAIEKLRVEAARPLIEQGRHPIDVIVHEMGFADRERMRRAFLRAFGQPPLAIRSNIRAAA